MLVERRSPTIAGCSTRAEVPGAGGHLSPEVDAEGVGRAADSDDAGEIGEEEEDASEREAPCADHPPPKVGASRAAVSLQPLRSEPRVEGSGVEAPRERGGGQGDGGSVGGEVGEGGNHRPDGKADDE